MMKVLLNNQKKIMMNTLRTQSLKNAIIYLVSIIIVGGLLIFASIGIWSASNLVTGHVLAGLLTYVFLMVIGLIILMGVPQVFKDMYAATDLELLFTMPISTRHIFWMKYLKSLAGVPLFAFILLVLPASVYGMATNASILYYPVALLVILAVIIIGLSIAYLFNLILIQIIPASRANEFMTVTGVLSGILVYLVIMLPNMTNNEPISELLLSGLPLLPKWVPVSWASVAIIEALNGSIGFVLPLVLLLVFAFLSVVLATTLVERGFRSGWIRLSEGSHKKKRKRKQEKLHKRQHPVIAIGKKEWLTIKRDIREWLVFMPIAFFLIFGLIGFFSGSDGIELSSIREFNQISWPIVQGVLLFVFAMTGGLVAASSIGREGAGLWILEILPLSGKQIALGKLWISWLLPFALLTIIECVLGVIFGWTAIQFVLGIFAKAIITIGISSIGLWLGTIGAKYHPTNPQARLKFGVSIILLISSWIYLVIIMIPYIYLLLPLGEINFPVEIEPGAPAFIVSAIDIVGTLIAWKISAPIVVWIVGLLVLAIISLGTASLFLFTAARNIDKGIKIDIVNEAKARPLFGRRKSGGSLY